MKKKLFVMIAMLCIAAFVLAACGGGGNTPAPAGGDTPAGSGNAPAGGGSTPAASAEIFDVGSFKVAVPAGWTAFPQNDIFGEQDKDGNYPVDPNSIVIAKGASDEWSAMTGPSIRIYYYEPDSYVMDSRSFYEDVKDIEGIKINGVDCTAYSGDSMGYIYQVISYVPEGAQYDISVLTSVDGKETGITWDDPEVMSILESLEANKTK